VSLKSVPGQRFSVIGTKTVPWTLHESKKTDALEALDQFTFTWKSNKISLQYHLSGVCSEFDELSHVTRMLASTFRTIYIQEDTQEVAVCH